MNILMCRKASFWFKTGRWQKAWRDEHERYYAKSNDLALSA